MLTLSGKVLDVIPGRTNQTTGQIYPPAVEILHKVKGKSQVEQLKIDPKTQGAWEKASGQNITIEVNYYAMKGTEGAIVSGLSLADKSALPTVQAAAPRAVGVAA